MKLKQTFIWLFCFAAIFTMQLQAQVTIGSRHVPILGSLLDLKETDGDKENSTKGLLLPRVLLEDLGSLEPVYSNTDSDEIKGHTGLVVFNMTDDPDKGLCKGVYVWTESAWIRFPKPCEPSIDPDLEHTPNCYMVALGGKVEIPVGKPYLVWGKYNGLNALTISDKVTAELVWQDKSNLISSVGLLDNKDSGPASVIEVKTTASVKGNALVAVRIGPNGNDSDPICWSWHIWVTDTPQEYVTQNNEGASYTFMDRNLGAISTTNADAGSLGLVYQWGRKDPFPGPLGYGYGADLNKYSIVYDASGAPIAETTPNGIQHIAISDNANLGNAIQNPKNFYYNAIENDLGDWYTLTQANQDNDLWVTADRKKSVYDPCPAGWRVPERRNNGTPWSTYLRSGWGGSSKISQVGDDGFNVGGMSGTVALGFYPIIPIKNGENYSDGGDGGVFNSPSYIINDIVDTGGYWTSDALNTTSKKTLSASFEMHGFGIDFDFVNKELPRATGLPVRCVKDIN